MVNPQPRRGAEPLDPYAEEDWLIRHIREHIAKGNKPDWERAEQLTREMDEILAEKGPSGALDGQTDEEIGQLAVDLVRQVRREEDLPRASTVWPLECE